MSRQALIIDAVQSELTALLAQKASPAAAIDVQYRDLLHEITLFIGRGGKRIRPLLCVLAYEGYGGREPSKIYKAAASQELFHAFLLMHDDIIDRDDTRYGGPNIAGRYKTKFKTMKNSNDREHYSMAWALLSGDVCMSLANEALLTSGFSAAKLVQAATVLQATLFDVIGGELLDVALSLPGSQTPTKAQLLKVCHYKTAVYSFSTPLHIGALLAGAPDSALSRIATFGQNLGIAYQLHDDLLGMFGDSRHTGKPIVSDLREGKRTVLIHYGLALATPPDRAYLEQQLGNPDVSVAAHQRVCTILIDCGAQQKTQALANTYAHRAKVTLAGLKFSKSTRTLLEDVMAKLVNRVQ